MTGAPHTATAWRHEPGLVGRTVEAVIGPLQEQYVEDYASSAVSRLAQLRRGAGKAPEDVPELFGLSGLEGLYEHGPLSLKKERRATLAVHTAVTLYALHQQSQRSQRMHQRGYGLGATVRMLMPPKEIDESLRMRLVRIGTAQSMPLCSDRLRQVVLLLRRHGVPLDYVLLADQLERVQDPRSSAGVRQEWGRDFHAWRPREDDKTRSDKATGPASDPTAPSTADR